MTSSANFAGAYWKLIPIITSNPKDDRSKILLRSQSLISQAHPTILRMILVCRTLGVLRAMTMISPEVVEISEVEARAAIGDEIRGIRLTSSMRELVLASVPRKAHLAHEK